MRDWYTKNLGIVTNEYGSSFESRNINKPEEINILQWSPFKKSQNILSHQKKEFMINTDTVSAFTLLILF